MSPNKEELTKIIKDLKDNKTLNKDNIYNGVRKHIGKQSLESIHQIIQDVRETLPERCTSANTTQEG